MTQDKTNDFGELLDLYGSKKEEEANRYRQMIIKEVKRLGCANRKEIALFLGISDEKAYPIIGMMIREGKLMRRPLNPREVPLLLRPRMRYFWDLGLNGYAGFNKHFWIEICTGHETDHDAELIKHDDNIDVMT